MAANPMQRQAKNYFLLGMVITALLLGVVIFFIFRNLQKVTDQNKQYESQMQQIWVLNQDVNSGDVLTSDMFSQVKASKSTIPSDYSDINTLLSAYSLYTKDGQRITSSYSASTNQNSGNAGNQQHLYVNNKEVLTDENGNYYIEENGKREIIETVEAPVIIKTAAKANTIITQSLISRSDEVDTDDVRKQEYNMLSLPIDLVTGDYVDVRLMLPNGQDFILVSKKRVTIPDVGGAYLADTVQMNLAEEEILTMSCAIVEAYRMPASKLYVTKYSEAGRQEAAIPNYVVNSDVAREIDADPNIVEEARKALLERYTDSAKALRNQYINGAVSTYGDDEGLETKMEQSITSTQESRQQYLQTLTGGATTTSTTTAPSTSDTTTTTTTTP